MLADCFRPWLLQLLRLLLPLKTGTGLIMEFLFAPKLPTPLDGEMVRVGLDADALLKQLPVFARLRFSKFDAAIPFLLEAPVLNCNFWILSLGVNTPTGGPLAYDACPP